MNMNDEQIELQLQEALFTLATGATVEEIGRDAQGNTKIFKRKLPPNLDAIKYLCEQKKRKHFNAYIPTALERHDDGNN